MTSDDKTVDQLVHSAIIKGKHAHDTQVTRIHTHYTHTHTNTMHTHYAHTLYTHTHASVNRKVLATCEAPLACPPYCQFPLPFLQSGTETVAGGSGRRETERKREV